MSAPGSYTKDGPKLFANIESHTLINIKCACEALWDNNCTIKNLSQEGIANTDAS